MPSHRNDDDERDLEELPQHLRAEVDRVFDKMVHPGEDERARRRKRRKLNSGAPSPAPGGFVANDEGGGFMVDDDAGGGFIPEEPVDGGGGFLLEPTSGPSITPASRSASVERTHMPLSSVPAALKMLKLPPDDEEVLAIFQDAAAGWGDKDGQQGVSIDDWRAVCAVLLSQRKEDVEDPIEDDDEDEFEEDSSAGGDLYRLEDDEDDEYGGEEEGAGDDYEEGYTGTSRGRRRKRRLSGEVDSVTTFSDLNQRQRKECRDAFELFMSPDEQRGPGVSRKITAQDLDRVGKLLNEQLSASEIDEMLEAFATSSDKSVSIEDFARVMIQSNMV